MIREHFGRKRATKKDSSHSIEQFKESMAALGRVATTETEHPLTSPEGMLRNVVVLDDHHQSSLPLNVIALDSRRPQHPKTRAQKGM